MEVSLLDLDLDFDQLSKETFDVCRDVTHNNPFGADSSLFPPQIEYPDAPGLIFRVEGGDSTFCLRSYPALSIKEFFSEELFLDKEIAHTLRMKDQFELPRLFCFETPSIEVAEVIADQLSNRRFPYEDDDLFNLSDPGHNWWLTILDNGFSLSFKGHQPKSSEGAVVKLGPIGDHMLASAVFSASKEILESRLGLRDLLVNDRIFKVSSEIGNPLLNAIQNLFLNGDDPTNREEFHFDHIGITLYCFLQELAYLRRFWIVIEKELQLKTNRISQ